MGDRRSTALLVKSRLNMRLSKLCCLLPLGLLWLPTAGHAADVQAAVTLGGQRVRLDDDKHELTVEVTVHNGLDVGLAAVEVGWLLATTPQALEAVTDPGALYLDDEDPKHGKAPPGVTVIRRSVAVVVPPHGQAPALLAVPITGGAPEVYRTHVLGYALADAHLPLLLRLLNGSAAADERAAVDFFAEASIAPARLAVRNRLDTELWLAELEPRLTAPVPQRPTASELHERLFLVRAMGVVGGRHAEELLANLRDRGDLAFFDDLLRVVLIDRLRGTRLETPLAFVVPPSARSFRDVVDAALADVRSLENEGRAPIADGRLPMADSRVPIADGRWPITDGRLPAADGRAAMADGGLASPDDRDLIARDRSASRGGGLANAELGDAVSDSLLRRWWVHAAGLAVVVAASMVMLLFLRRKA